MARRVSVVEGLERDRLRMLRGRFVGGGLLTPIVRTTLGASLGANVLERLGGQIASQGAQGLQNVGNFLPVIGTLGAGRLALSSLRLLQVSGGRSRSRR